MVCHFAIQIGHISRLPPHDIMALWPAMGERPAHERAVTVAAAANAERMVKVAVRDRGTGIARGDLERVFEPFHTTKRDGLGIGLSISRTIVTIHRGRLWAENNPARGATFCFTVPIAAPNSAQH